MLSLGSLFTGIGGFDLGFERAGFKTLWQVEIDDDCHEVLSRHFPDAKRFKDVKYVGKDQLVAVNCICFGAPCQDVSVAGRRAGLGGERTGLFYEAARILQELRPAWFVFENVPGLFSSNDGRDFAEVQRVLMVQCGYGISWRVFNSQFFGVAQRRERVFIVGSIGKPCPAEILFEPASGKRNSSPRSETWENLAANITSGTGRVGSRGCDDGANIIASSGERERALTASMWKRHDEDTNTLIATTLQGGGHSGQPEPGNGIVIAHALRESDGHHRYSSARGDGCDNLVPAQCLSNAKHECQIEDAKSEGQPKFDAGRIAATLNSGGNSGGFRTEPGEHLVAYALRRDPGGIGQGHNTTYAITENMRNRSQGPANYVSAEIDSNRVRSFAGLPKGMDSRRYRQLGNAVTVNVAEWIARRIVNYEHH